MLLLIRDCESVMKSLITRTLSLFPTLLELFFIELPLLHKRSVVDNRVILNVIFMFFFCLSNNDMTFKIII
jgi:hypothetical protein